jgi:hypothetical protein
MDDVIADWEALKCRHGCSSPVVGIYHAPNGCLCFPDPVQALCGQHAIKGMQNNEMTVLIARQGFIAGGLNPQLVLSEEDALKRLRLLEDWLCLLGIAGRRDAST